MGVGVGVVLALEDVVIMFKLLSRLEIHCVYRSRMSDSRRVFTKVAHPRIHPPSSNGCNL